MIILSVIIIIGFYTAFKALGACHPCNYTLDAFKTILRAIRHVITANKNHDSTAARPDHFRKRRQPEKSKAARDFYGLNSIVQNAQKPLFYRPDAVQRKQSKHMNISTYINTNHVKLEPSNSKIGIS